MWPLTSWSGKRAPYLQQVNDVGSASLAKVVQTSGPSIDD